MSLLTACFLQQLYLASVGIGGGNYSVIVDTGSSNTWIGANKPYVPGPQSVNTGMAVGITYGSGGFIGEECKSLPYIIPNIIPYSR